MGGDVTGTSTACTVVRVPDSALVQGTRITLTTTGGRAKVSAATQTATGAAGGDLSGTYPNPLVAKVPTFALIAGTNTSITTTTGKSVISASIPVQTLIKSGSTYTPVGTHTYSIVYVKTPTANFTVANPSGTALDGGVMLLRIPASGAHTISWGTIYKSSGVATLPTTTVTSKTITIGLQYNANKTEWVCMAADSIGY